MSTQNKTSARVRCGRLVRLAYHTLWFEWHISGIKNSAFNYGVRPQYWHHLVRALHHANALTRLSPNAADEQRRGKESNHE